MVVNPDRKFMTPQEYLDWEEQQPIKYEYITSAFIRVHLLSSALKKSQISDTNQKPHLCSSVVKKNFN